METIRIDGNFLYTVNIDSLVLKTDYHSSLLQYSQHSSLNFFCIFHHFNNIIQVNKL